jgi:Fe-S oxidoreductase
MAKLKAEFLQHYHDANGVPFRSKLIANFSTSAKLGSIAPSIYNFMMKQPFISKTIKKVIGFAPERSMPLLHNETLLHWDEKRQKDVKEKTGTKTVYLFCDEFTNFNDTPIGIKTILLLEHLGYQVIIPYHLDSGRAPMSKGLLKKAKVFANGNVQLLHPLVSADKPLIGIEPSAILSFRDEYPDLVDEELHSQAVELAKHVFMIDEFIANEIDKGNIKKEQFTTVSKEIKLHGHCQQKAVGALSNTVKVLSFPENFKVETIPSGCCGMAGSFGYEKEHYELSIQVSELVLMPFVRKQPESVIIAAPGTSCRHQIKDGAHRKALHPVEVLYDALVR